MGNFDRRRFIKSSVVGASTALLSSTAWSALHWSVDRGAPLQKKPIQRLLGKTGIQLPVVSMGVMRSDNPALVRAALEAGIRHLDTAHGYMKGKNEEMLGDLLKDYPRDSFVISTKVPPEDTERFAETLDVSLQRLRMAYVDILYLHGVTSRDGLLHRPTLEALKAAKVGGKAKYVGVSTHKNEPEVLRAAIESGVCEVVLTSVNFKQGHYAEVKKAIAEAAAAGIGIIAMKTMAGAFYDRDRTQPIDCRAALKWVLQDEHVTTAIPGITTFEQLEQNASVNEDLVLTDEEKSHLGGGNLEGGLYCQGCEQCVPGCPRRLPIPEIMRAYMYTYGYGDAAAAHDLLKSLKVKGNPCEGCRTCAASCPKHFDIAERIGDIARLTNVPREFLC